MKYAKVSAALLQDIVNVLAELPSGKQVPNSKKIVAVLLLEVLELSQTFEEDDSSK